MTETHARRTLRVMKQETAWVGYLPPMSLHAQRRIHARPVTSAWRTDRAAAELLSPSPLPPVRFAPAIAFGALNARIQELSNAPVIFGVTSPLLSPFPISKCGLLSPFPIWKLKSLREHQRSPGSGERSIHSQTSPFKWWTPSQTLTFG
jgi:hypothetical protein